MKASVIIPSYNSKERLFYNLLSLNRQTCPRKSFEVIVVDNGSSDETYKMLTSFKANFELIPIKLDNNMGRAYGRNAGIEKAKGDILIFHDSDMLVPSNFISSHLSEHNDDNTAVCGMFWGRIFSYYYDSFSEVQKYYFQLSNHPARLKQSVNSVRDMLPLLTKGQIRNGSFMKYGSFDKSHNPFKEVVDIYGEDLQGYHFPWRFFITNNCSASKKAVLEAGLFDNNFLAWGGEDYDLGYRLYHKGCKFKFRNKIISLHQEHPAHPSVGDPVNSFYLCDKYDAIDILLFIFCKNTSINNASINSIMDEIDALKLKGKFDYTINAYNELLKIIRERSKDYIINDNKNAFAAPLDIRDAKNIDLGILAKQIKEISSDYGAKCFVDSLHALLSDTFGVKTI